MGNTPTPPGAIWRSNLVTGWSSPDSAPAPRRLSSYPGTEAERSPTAASAARAATMPMSIASMLPFFIGQYLPFTVSCPGPAGNKAGSPLLSMIPNFRGKSQQKIQGKRKSWAKKQRRGRDFPAHCFFLSAGGLGAGVELLVQSGLLPGGSVLGQHTLGGSLVDALYSGAHSGSLVLRVVLDGGVGPLDLGLSAGS